MSWQVTLGVGLAVGLGVWLLSGLRVDEGPDERLVRLCRDRGLVLPPGPWVSLWLAGWGALVLVAVGSTGGARGVLLGAGIALVGVLAPWIGDRIWRAELETALATGAVDLLRQWAIGSDSGLLPAAALADAVRHCDGPIALEARRVLVGHAIRCGSLAECWRRRARRLGSETLGEIGAVVAAVESSGAPYTVLLNTLAGSIEHRLQYRSRTRAVARGPLVEIGACQALILGMAMVAQDLPAAMGLEGQPPLFDTWHWVVLLGSLALSAGLAGWAIRADRFLG